MVRSGRQLVEHEEGISGSAGNLRVVARADGNQLRWFSSLENNQNGVENAINVHPALHRFANNAA
jgi:hypothetical protein